MPRDGVADDLADALDPLMVEVAKRVELGDFSARALPGKAHGEMAEMVEAFNRMTRELERRQDQLIQEKKLSSLGVLTSGGTVRSIDGVDTLARMVATRGDVEIMAGGGIRTEDIPAILATGVQAVHLSARGQAGLDAPAGPGGGTAGHDITDPALVVAAVTATRG